MSITVGDPSLRVRRLVLDRAGGLCELDRTNPAENIHHRKPRGAGGTYDPRLNEPSNLLALCGSGTTGCHGWIESHRDEAYELGLLVHRWDSPERTAFRDMAGHWYRLDDEGGKDLVRRDSTGWDVTD